MSIVSTTVQAAALSVLSNVLAQLISSYQENKPLLNFNLTSILQFVAYTILNVPINCLWQEWLEEQFPGSKPVPAQQGDEKKQKSKGDTKPADDEKKADEKKKKKKKEEEQTTVWTNVAIKFLLDQTVGAAMNITLFLAGIGALKGQGYDQIVKSIKKDSWPIYVNGAKLWPAVSAVMFVAIPVQRRVILGSVVGVAWNIYLSLMAI